ncbi:MAG: hypothetical protein ACRD08_02045 [Acidimicrobiales bacterium]
MRNAIRLALGAVAALLLLAPGANAQSCTGNPCSVDNLVQVNVPTILRLTLSAATTVLPQPGETEFSAGFQDAAGPSATVRANRPWNLQVNGQAATWTGSNGGRANKPVGDLQWSTTGGAPFAALTTTAANVFGTSQAAGGNQVTNFTYHVLWSYTPDTPGDYELTVRYTVTAP